MRYFTLKPTYDATEGINGTTVKISYKDMLIGVITAQAQLNPDQFMRTTTLFSQVKNAVEGEVLAIEDQDYAVIALKLPTYVSTLTGFAVALPDISTFIKSIADMPKTKLEVV